MKPSDKAALDAGLPEPSMKQVVREYLDNMKDKGWFTVASLAKQLKVDPKAVHNAMAPYLANGSMQKEKTEGQNHCIYRRVNNVAVAVALKTKFDDRLHKTVTKKAPAKRRSPFIMAIDTEIKRMEQRIVLLRKTRREFE